MLPQVQDLCVLSTLLGDVMSITERAACGLQRQAWQTLERDIMDAPSSAALEKKLHTALHLGVGPTLRRVYEFALYHMTTHHLPCVEI